MGKSLRRRMMWAFEGKQLAMGLSSHAFKEITWREGTDHELQSRFAAIRVRAAHRDYEKTEPHAEEWLLIEWPRGEKEPTKYWVSTLPAHSSKLWSRWPNIVGSLN
jgi:SRSO17 transposase